MSITNKIFMCIGLAVAMEVVGGELVARPAMAAADALEASDKMPASDEMAPSAAIPSDDGVIEPAPTVAVPQGEASAAEPADLEVRDNGVAEAGAEFVDDAIAQEPPPGEEATGDEVVAAEVPPTSPAQVVVARLNASLLNVLTQSNELNYRQRFDLLAPALEETFDLKYMARQSVGRSFLDLEEDHRQTWYALFAEYMAANYACRFDHFSGQHFEMLGEEPGAKGTVLVKTQVVDPEQENVDLSYRLRETPSGWKVVDVYLKGTVSELALRRSEYATVLKREGFEPLVASITKRIEQLESGTD